MLSRTGILKWSLLPRIRSIRTFLSGEHACKTAWEARLSSPILQNIKLDSFYYDIDNSFQQQGKANAIDIDIFVNKVSNIDETLIDEIADLLHKFRLTEETTNALQSTGHAVIRNYVDGGYITELIEILDDRLSYGIFLDAYIANYTLNVLIKKEDFQSAARIATFLMLQEDFDNEISQALSLYSCYRYLDNIQPFYPPKEELSETGDVVKVRVKFLRNPFFDDHFDLRDHKHLVGKTLLMLSKRMKPSAINKNIEFLGSILYQKYEKASEIIKKYGNELYSCTVQKSLELLPTDDDDVVSKIQDELERLQSSGKLNTTKFEESLKELIRNVVQKKENEEIELQSNIYADWNRLRETKLEEEQNRLRRVKRLQEIEKLTEDMKREEEKLWFFDNEDKVDLQIDSKIVRYPKRWFGKKKKPRVIDEGYIPPEIIKQRK